MHDVSPVRLHGIPAVSPTIRWQRVKTALGVSTNAEVAERTGIPLRTLDRLFINPDSSLLRNARRLSALTGIGMDELFPADDLAEAA
ncbi:hypothetical protein [Verrucosispora sp. NA02020]|uniref:hypothetical protein n=1 Tax=Verrucosispora sp. NA02020 TaxID=2742132 RepID=UPI00159203E1|nr:hypothetical protein [Verrucosispora sp. NA02020]QKW15306.1 hypothetical protein HUT12_22805 [Verrucosispora sp. NA02020]